MKINSSSLCASICLGSLIALGSSAALATQGAAPNGSLVSQIDYVFVAYLGQLDQEGRLLVWEATIGGDVNGEMKWWFEVPSPVAASSFSFYTGRWEVWSDGKLVLAGESAGKTVFPNGVYPNAPDGVWDGHGVVTEAYGRYGLLKGRRIYETGPVVIGETPPVSFHGTGMFTIY